MFCINLCKALAPQMFLCKNLRVDFQFSVCPAWVPHLWPSVVFFVLLQLPLQCCLSGHLAILTKKFFSRNFRFRLQAELLQKALSCHNRCNYLHHVCLHHLCLHHWWIHHLCLHHWWIHHWWIHHWWIHHWRIHHWCLHYNNLNFHLQSLQMCRRKGFNSS